MRRAGPYKKSDEELLRERFPSKVARDIADRSVDEIDPREPMVVFIDRWLESYKRAGGVIRD